MKLEQHTPSIFELTLHAYELATLIAAARWAVEGGEGTLPDEARQSLQQLLEDYDAVRGHASP